MLFRSWPSVARWPRWALLPYLFLADGQNTILSALFIFSGRLLYPYYASVPSVAGFTPMDDQIVAGAIMWVPGSIFYLVPAAQIMLTMLAPQNLTGRFTRADYVHPRITGEVPSTTHS